MAFSEKAILGGLFLVVVGATGCSAQQAAEPEQSSQSKLLAPRALFKAKASAETLKALNVAEWRVYRGKSAFVLTGYTASGKPVAGASVSFVKDGTNNVVRARTLDGTYFSSKYVFGGKVSTNRTASSGTTMLFARAMSDMSAVRAGLAHKGRVHHSIGLPLPAGAQPDCGADLSTVLSSALQCIQQSGTSKDAALACVLSAQSAATSQTTCDGGGGGLDDDPYDPTGDLGGPYGAGDQGQGGPYGPDDQGGQGGPYGPDDQGGQDGPYGPDDQGGQGGPYGPDDQGGQAGPYGQGGQGGDPYGDGPYGQDPLGQGDPFGDGMCQSCQGGYDDIDASPDNGGVCYGDGAGGDMGGDQGGDMGGADMGGDMGGYGEGY